MLTDQVEAQGEKIRDLEFTKEEMQIKFEEAEQFLESVSVFFPLLKIKFLRSAREKNYWGVMCTIVLARLGKCPTVAQACTSWVLTEYGQECLLSGQYSIVHYLNWLS